MAARRATRAAVRGLMGVREQLDKHQQRQQICFTATHPVMPIEEHVVKS